MNSYMDFVKNKATRDDPSGFSIDDVGFGGVPLKPFQSHIVKWALRRGRAAIFANTGLGKTAMRDEYGPGMGYVRLSRKYQCGVSTVRDIVQYRTRWNA